MNIDIKANLSNYEELERQYNADKKGFRTEFDKVYPEIESMPVARVWKARLDNYFRSSLTGAFSMREILQVIGVIFITAILIKLPAILQLGISDDAFYSKNAAIIVLGSLTFYTILIKGITGTRRLVIALLAFLIPAVYINLLPSVNPGDSVILAYIHLPLLMLYIYGFIYNDYSLGNTVARMDFIRRNAEMAVVFAMIAIAGGLMTGITIGLFDSIGMNIEEFYASNIIVAGASCAPVIAVFLIDKFPDLAGRISQLIATIFSPLVLITLVVFLATMLITGKDPYNDRDFLVIFNVMLLGVVGIIIFSVSGSSQARDQGINIFILTGLSIITIIVDLIALSAIIYRLGEFGLTPNRMAVVVSNLLVLVNLVLIMLNMLRIIMKKGDSLAVENTVSKFLPVYLIWVFIVVFGFPLFFGFN